MSIRVLHIINNLDTGGAQVCLRDIACSDFQHSEIFVYTLRADKGKYKFNSEIFFSGYSNYDIRKFFFLIKLCKKLEIDIVHAHLHKSCMFAIMLKVFYKCKVVLHEHGPIERNGISYSFYRLFMRLFGKFSDCIIAVSEDIAKTVRSITKISDKKLFVLHNPVDTKAFSPNQAVREKQRAIYNLADSFVVGFIGRIRYIKGLDLLIKAFDMITRDEQNIKLLIVGDGTDIKSMKQLAGECKFSNDIIFTGFCDKRYEIIQAFDLGVVPSRQEAFGLSAIELMAAGIAVATSGAGGIAEILADYECAELFQNDPQDIAKCVNMLISQPQRLKELRENGLQRVKAFDKKHYIANLNSIYKQVLS